MRIRERVAETSKQAAIAMEANLDADRDVNSSRLPDGCCAVPGRIIVCEHSGCWAAALRRQWSCRAEAVCRWPIEETRSLSECWQRLVQAPAAFVIVELSGGNLQTLLQRMLDLPWRFPLARLAVVARGDAFEREWLRRCELLTRQAGAVFFGTCLRNEGPQGTGGLADVAHRHLRQSPQPPLSDRERIWSRLPWQAITAADPDGRRL